MDACALVCSSGSVGLRRRRGGFPEECFTEKKEEESAKAERTRGLFFTGTGMRALASDGTQRAAVL